MNTGGAAAPGFRRGVELLREGVLGDVRQVHVSFARGGRNFQHTLQGSQPVPKELDWDLWLAQVKWREYHPDWMSYAHWRETRSGGLGSFGPHTTIVPGETLTYDPLAGRITSHAEANQQLAYPYRDGWRL